MGKVQKSLLQPHLFSIEELPFAILLLTKEKKISGANSLAKKLLGVSKKHFGKIFTELFHESAKKHIADHIKPIKKQNSAPFTIEREYKKQRQFLRVTIRAINSSYVVFFEDQTREKQQEKGREIFFAIASHDVKSLLTSIKAYIQLLQRKVPVTSEFISYISRLDEQVNKLTALIVDLVDVSRIRAGKLQIEKNLFDINELIATIVADMQITTKQKIVLKGKVKKPVLGDKTRLSQVITNFISNAIKYSGPRKQILITLSQSMKDCTVSVQDFGKGIGEKDQGKIFNLFYQSGKNDEGKDGLGIGLYISKAVILAHKGSIGVKSTQKKGSTFFFKIPLS